MEKSIGFDHLTLGVCYYPEHWDRSLWRSDLQRMKQSGIEIARIGEFAWTLFEPREGEFDFSLFDDFLDVALEEGVQIIFGTPTATPPAWLTHKYPESLNARMDGVLFRHGMRCHCNHTSEKFIELSARIVEQLAAHFGGHPAIIGWQIDNEINCETADYYSESDHRAFREYLKQKFGSLEALNEALGMVFWSQSYSAWEQVYLPRPTVAGAHNPHLLLEQKRFISWASIRYFAMQAEILRKHVGERFVTTNGVFGHIDNTELTQEHLDFMTYDSYPNFANSVEPDFVPDPLRDRMSAQSLAKVRALSPNYGIMEQQSGGGGWTGRLLQSMPKPGQLRIWAYQSIAHGGDFISFFRWRTAPYGTEIYWHGILDYDNRDNRRLAEVQTLASELKHVQEMAGAKYVAKVAVLNDTSNEWDGETDRFYGPMARHSVKEIFRASQLTHTPVDLLNLSGVKSLDDLLKYSLIFYPHPAILEEETAALLTKYVEQGGKLVFGARTGYKDKYGRCPMMPMPGFAAKLCGVTVEEFTLTDDKYSPVFVQFAHDRVPAPWSNDVLSPAGASVEGVYQSAHYEGKPAVTKNIVGKGEAWYHGFGFTLESVSKLFALTGVIAPFAGVLALPRELEIAVREKEGKRYYFVLNYLGTAQRFVAKQPLTNLLNGETISDEVEIPPYGVCILA